jgi:rhodanese-related sulfurtransferase
MFTNKKTIAITLVLLLLSLMATACVAQPSVDQLIEEAAPVVEEQPAEEVTVDLEEEPAEEMAEEPVAVAEEADLDSAFNTFLGDLEGYGVITVDALNTALAEEQPFLLDVRQPSELEEGGHIEGAINIPLRELAQHTDLLPGFDTPIVVYCGSGTRSTIGMTALEGLGWTDVKSMKGGMAAWVEAGYPVAEGPAPEAEVMAAAEPDPALLASIDANLSTFPEGWGIVTVENLVTELVENPDLAIVDVRRQDELDENGWVEGSTHIALEEFVAGKANWPADKDAPVVVYCGSGWRSAIAMTIMRSYGYTDVRSLKGGFGAWAEAGNPVVQE